MLYPLIPIGLALVFAIYLVYSIFIAKDFRKNFKLIVLPCLLFFTLWAVIYFAWLS